MKITTAKLMDIIREEIAENLMPESKKCSGCKGKNPGLWCNICRKRARGERPARPGEKGYPKTLTIETNIKSYMNILKEENDTTTSAKPGKEKADVKGSLDVKKIASTLGVDASKLSDAVKAAKSGTRSASHNAILGDVFIKLMEASPNDTVTVMNVLKKVVEK